MRVEQITLILFSVHPIITVVPNCIVNCFELEGGYKILALSSFIVSLHTQCISTRHKINVVKTKQSYCKSSHMERQTGKHKCFKLHINKITNTTKKRKLKQKISNFPPSNALNETSMEVTCSEMHKRQVPGSCVQPAGAEQWAQQRHLAFSCFPLCCSCGLLVTTEQPSLLAKLNYFLRIMMEAEDSKLTDGSSGNEGDPQQSSLKAQC